ncbi:carbohydrate ABC transporter permease [Paenibacillus sp. IB182496]|uniref:Carbohydrate ABC transporter permease n=1 Tax=Paenibacillus sabuli TaxID=2772509 RepID=A0A927BSD2_9BACL|nr:carbohydrate ABC transporter permease [Paenibacillus sabuli]MBD2844553.1 carbohydrate ABC transporter permease [Paenibacillus sabuli]
MKIKTSMASRVFDAFNVTLMLILAAVMLYPIVYVASASISNVGLVVNGTVKLWPRDLTFIAYERVFADPFIWLSYGNTIRYTVIQTAATLLVTSMMAYPLAKRRLLGRRTILLFAAATMLFNGGLIPTFLVVKQLGLIDTIWAVIVPTLINTWYLFIMRTFFEQLPEELEEAARIDGCGVMGTLLRIVMPLSKPVLMTIGLFTAVTQWNSFFDALIYLNQKELYPLQIHLRNIVIAGTAAAQSQGSAGDDEIMLLETVKYSTIMVAALPILCVYPFIQKYFVQGTMIGGIKG